MPNYENIINILGIATLLTIIALVVVLLSKMEKIKALDGIVEKLKRSLDEMDEQAKLVVRTDMELNKTQEELDKKITGLYTLQKLSRLISATLEESQIFKMIGSEQIKNLGFEKACAFLWDEEEKKFIFCLNIGYTGEEIETLKSDADLNKRIHLELTGGQKAISSLSIKDAVLRDKINSIFKVISFVASAILPKEGKKGFLLVGTESLDTTVTEGDEELITILTNEIGQAMENACLFEKTWRSQQDLEKKVEERTLELTRLLNEVKIISKRKTDFVSSVSHELRTPLTSIKGYASILLAGKLGEIPKEVYERLDKINRHSDELVHMVNDLLDISRIESGKMLMKQEPCDLNSIVAKISDLLALEAKTKEIELSAHLAPDAQKVFADSNQTERVFINLIGNALKFTPQKGKITITSRKTDKTVQVDITDTGYGIPEDAQEAIFEEFYRVDNPINQQVKGTGLGLALVKHIVEANAGKIWVKSKAGSGSTFSFTLPAQL